MITSAYKSAFLAFEGSNRQRYFLSMPAIAASLTRISGISSFKRPSSIFSFVVRYLEKLAPGYVKNCFCKTMILHHRANIQILDSDPVKAFDQIHGYFMVKMSARSLYSQISKRDFRSS